MEFIDTHTHTYDEAFDGCEDEVIGRALDAGVSVMLQAHHDITPQQYVKWHPGGSLGKLRDSEK